MEKVAQSIIELCKKQGLPFLLLLAGFYYFYQKDQNNESLRTISAEKVQLQLDTLNRRIDICRATYEHVLLNQVMENTNLLKDVKELMKASLEATPMKYRPKQELSSLN